MRDRRDRRRDLARRRPAPDPVARPQADLGPEGIRIGRRRSSDRPIGLGRRGVVVAQGAEHGGAARRAAAAIVAGRIAAAVPRLDRRDEVRPEAGPPRAILRSRLGRSRRSSGFRPAASAVHRARRRTRPGVGSSRPAASASASAPAARPGGAGPRPGRPGSRRAAGGRARPRSGGVSGRLRPRRPDPAAGRGGPGPVVRCGPRGPNRSRSSYAARPVAGHRPRHRAGPDPAGAAGRRGPAARSPSPPRSRCGPHHVADGLARPSPALSGIGRGPPASCPRPSRPDPGRAGPAPERLAGKHRGARG